MADATKEVPLTAVQVDALVGYGGVARFSVSKVNETYRW